MAVPGFTAVFVLQQSLVLAVYDLATVSDFSSGRVCIWPAYIATPRSPRPLPALQLHPPLLLTRHVAPLLAALAEWAGAHQGEPQLRKAL